MNNYLEILPIHENDGNKKKRQIVENPKGALVLVHGICHGAWCWENFINFFADNGYQCYAISLPGHGGSGGKEHLRNYRLSDYVEAVKEAMETIKKDMEAHNLREVKPFLLGHSMGGAIVQQYIGKYENDVQGAILYAPATAPKMKRGDIFPKNKNLRYATYIAWDWFKAGKKREEHVHNAAFYTGKDENGKIIQRIEDTSRYVPLLQAESKKITGGILALAIPGDLAKRYSKNYNVHIPVFVVGSYADQYFGENSLKQTADEYAKNGSKTALVILERLCHDMMLDEKEWEASATPVLKFLENPIEFTDKNKHLPEKM